MDDYVADLLAEQDNPNGLLLEILTSGYEDWDYIIAIEGPADRVFYFDFLQASLKGNEFYVVDCGGKPNLLKFKDAIEGYSWVHPPKFRYLCDKDFDDYLRLDHPNVWKTHWYSIESYLTDQNYIMYGLNKHSTKTISLSKRQIFVNAYDDLFMKMAKSVRTYCAFMCELRASGEHPQFDAFGIERLFDLTKPNNPRRRGILHQAITLLGVDPKFTCSDILRRARTFSMEDVRKWLRGKLALQLARKCYENAIDSVPLEVRIAIPSAVFLAGGSLGSAHSFWGNLPGLTGYCTSP